MEQGLSPVERLFGELGVLHARAVATGAAGAVVSELDEYLLFGDDEIDAAQWQKLTWERFYGGTLPYDVTFDRRDRANALRDDPRSPRAVFASALCATSQYRGDPGRLDDGGIVNGGIVDAHELRVTTSWWTTYAAGDPAPSATVQELGIGKAERADWWYVYAVGPREQLSPAGVAGELRRCAPVLDADALADEAAAVASREAAAADVAATIVGLLRFAAPSATADLAEWERVVAGAAAAQYAQRAAEYAWVERDEMAQVGVSYLLRSPVCFIERPATELAGDGLGLERVVDLLVEQWFIDNSGTAHNVGPFLTAVPMARTPGGRWVQYADRQDVVGDTSTAARADAVRRHLATCNAF